MEYNFSNVLLILHVKYFYNRLRFKVVIDKSCSGDHFFPNTVYIGLSDEYNSYEAHWRETLSRVYTRATWLLSSTYMLTRNMLPGNKLLVLAICCKLLVRATCCLYPGNTITIHLCHGRLVSLCIQQRTGNKVATVLLLKRCKRGLRPTSYADVRILTWEVELHTIIHTVSCFSCVDLTMHCISRYTVIAATCRLIICRFYYFLLSPFSE